MHRPPSSVTETATLPLGTTAGEFQLRAFEDGSGELCLALAKGRVRGDHVLARLHSECLTGDALGSLRCDCGVQLQTALRAIAAEGRGVLLYLTGHEGRGIGLANKLRAYVLQHRGADTVDANERLGLPVDGRDYALAAEALRAMGVRSVRLLTNNPEKVRSLRAHGITVDAAVPLHVAPHLRNVAYLRTKQRRMGHTAPPTLSAAHANGATPDATDLLGRVRPHRDRPYVVLKYAQTLDGRIATSAGDSRWISGEAERAVSHALRAACDAVLVGVGTVLADDPHLTVRLVPGASPTRVVLDSTLRTPLDANVLAGTAPTIILTTRRSGASARDLLPAAGASIHVVEAGPRGVDLPSALAALRRLGIRSLLVEGGSTVITSFLDEGLADRLVVAVAPAIIGAGRDAVGDLGVRRMAQAIRLSNRSVVPVGDDVLLAGDVGPVDDPAAEPQESAEPLEPAEPQAASVERHADDGANGHHENAGGRGFSSTFPSRTRTSNDGCGAVAGP